MSGPSITRRVTAALVISQAIAFPVVLYSFYVSVYAQKLLSHSHDGILQGEGFAIEALARSLRPTPEGKIRIDPAGEIAVYAAQNPAFEYAAFNSSSKEPFQGSTSQIHPAQWLRKPIRLDQLRFGPDDGSDRPHACSLERRVTPVGKADLLVCGYAFGWAQVPSILMEILRQTFDIATISQITPLIVILAAVSWIMMRRSLTPLTRTMGALKLVDARTLGRPMPAEQVPTEIFPLVEAFNAALSRIDAGISKQRRFVANAAHELRTPVAILNARIDGPRKPTFEQDLKHDVRRIRNLFEQLLAASRLDELPDEADYRVDLVDVAQALVSDNLLVAIKSGKQIELEAPSSPIIVSGSPGAIQSALGNLIDNAVRAEPQGGTVIVRLSPDRVIEVVDHGPGVAEQEREVIFEPFWRKSGSTGGTGLGLSITKEIVEKLKGRVWLDETPGGGATFKLSFPAMETDPHDLAPSGRVS